jgi:DNA-binding NtrC family response regulator
MVSIVCSSVSLNCSLSKAPTAFSICDTREAPTRAELTPACLNTQAKVLRVIQEKEFERLGGGRTIKVDVRILSATNKDLAQAVQDKSFREDLYFRLNVITIKIPALRERKEDIPLLADYFLKKFAGDLKKSVRHISPGALSLLKRYQWPGNVRELENCLERAVLMCEGSEIKREDLFFMEDMETAKKIADSTEIFKLVVNIGDSKSIITHPASTTHQQLTAQELIDAGVPAGLVRLSVGLEDTGDLIADLKQALGQ